MKILAEKKALELLNGIRNSFADDVRINYEHRAKSCLTCDTPGACCLDEHFVNVRISRLEAVAIGGVLDSLPIERRDAVIRRIADAVERFGLDDSDDPLKTYACPLYEKGTGCLVHEKAKPLPCIQHACYESAADLPPDEMLDQAEQAVDAVNQRTYGGPQPLLPIPAAVERFAKIRRTS